MTRKNKKFNLENVNLEIFNSPNIDQYIDIPEDEEKINEKCQAFLSIDYPITLHKVNDENGSYWIAEHPDLPGCKTHGETKEQAILNLDDAKTGWIFSRLCDNEKIPTPTSSLEHNKYSGRILLRLPKDLHQKLIIKSKSQDISLNQVILYLLAYALGKTDTETKIKESLKEILDNYKPFSLSSNILRTANDPVQHTQNSRHKD